MRWLFVFLVFLNLFFYVWQKQQTPIINQAETLESSQIPTIQLAKEHPELTKPHKNEQPVEPIVKPSTPITCLYIGGFTNSEQLTVISTSLKKINSNIELDIIKPESIPTVELYITTTDENRSRIIEQLNKLSINSLIILRGILKDNISLGLFATEKDYTEIKNALTNTDILTKTNKLPKSAISYWLRIPNSQYALFDNELLTGLVKKFPTAQQELMPCQP